MRANFAQAQQLACEYRLADVRYADYGAGYDLAMFVFGELNVFRPEDLRSTFCAKLMPP